MNVGDIVVKVSGKKRTCSCRRDKTSTLKLGLGSTYTIAAVTPRCRCEYGPAIKLVGIENSSPNRGWCRGMFRLIDAHEACEAEFVTLLKRTKRKVQA